MADLMRAQVAPVLHTKIAAGLYHTLVCGDNGELLSFGDGRWVHKRRGSTRSLVGS